MSRLRIATWWPIRSASLVLVLATCLACLAGEPPSRRIAAVVTEYRENSHADVIVGRLLATDTLDGKGKAYPFRLVSLFTDQTPKNDISRRLSKEHHFPIAPTIADALTLGTKTLAADGVLIVAEHGVYPASPTGNHQYPKRRFWEETVKVFRDSGRVVPIFIDKHLSDNWNDAKAIYDSARELKIPLMAGSSVPSTWRYPPADVAPGARISEIVGFTYGSTDAYGFHALEALQALAEQRQGGETGVRSVQTLKGPDVWKALDTGVVDPALFDAALRRLPGHEQGEPIPRATVPSPKLMIVEHKDGLKTFLFELNGAVGNWTAAWRYQNDGKVESTQFWVQEDRPYFHFSILLEGVTSMMLTGKAAWPVERTLLNSGVLDALLQSEVQGGSKVETPYLDVSYQSRWRWKQPAPLQERSKNP